MCRMIIAMVVFSQIAGSILLNPSKTKLEKRRDTDCYDPNDFNSYRGRLRRTLDGHKCQNWSDNEPWRHTYKKERFPWAGLDENFCRNPDHDKAPWCFTRKWYYGLQWNYCKVTICEDSVATTSPSTTTDPGASTVAYEDMCGRPAIPMAKKINGELANKPPKIVGGNETIPGSIPWQISIRSKLSNRLLCSGSLYKRKWIISAAHCFVTQEVWKNFYIVLGEHSITHQNGTEQTVRKVKRVIKHPNYAWETHIDSDIALLELSAEVTYTDFIWPICLPPANEIPKHNTKVIASGWGRVGTSSPGSRNLLQVELRIVKKGKCQRLMNNEITDTMLCLGPKSGGKGPCFGDSGGPVFMKQKDGKYTLWGIISWGENGCAAVKKYSVSVMVSRFVDWIENETA